MFEPIEMIDNMLILTDSCYGVPDYHCLSVVSVWRKCGNQRMSAICSNFAEQMSKPFLNSCLDWMNRAEIKAKDFMVEEVPGVRKIWE